MENWKKVLKKMKLESIRKKAPDFFRESGSFDMKIRPYSDADANNLTRSIIDFINFSGGDAARISAQGQARRINGQMKWTHGSTRKGVADIHAIYQGRALSIEVKIGRDKMSEAQNKEAQRIRDAGGLYYVAKNFPDFLSWWNSEVVKECN